MAATLGALALIRSRFWIAPPSFGLPDDLRSDWEAYGSDLKLLDDQIAAGQTEIRTTAAEAMDRAAPVSPEAREEDLSGASIDDMVLEQVRSTEEMRIAAAANELRDASTAFQERLDGVISELSEITAPADGEITVSLAILKTLADENIGLLEGLAAQVGRVGLISSGDGPRLASSELEAAADRELLQLREELERDLELAQVGLAIGVVSHEFRQTVFHVREGLERLAIWGRRNPRLGELQREIASAFEHLDNYLALLTPLQRRIRVEPTQLKGKEIFRFLRDLFVDRVTAGKVSFEATPAFLSFEFLGKPAVFYPAFVNLVDNALFWLPESQRPPRIRLDVQDEALVIEDSGAGIPEGDKTRIFEPGFTRKPGGRGLGLFISKQVLERNGYDLLTGDSRLGGARFEIAAQEEAETA